MATLKNEARDKPRHSANYNRQAKKGGAGGKGTWGSPQQDYLYIDEDIHALDENDPNFDDDIDGTATQWALYEPAKALKASRSFMRSLEAASDFKETVEAAVRSLLMNHEIDDFIQTIRGLDVPELHHEIPKIAISSAMDSDEAARRLISDLLRQLAHEQIITPAQMSFAFRRLYNHLPDLCLDVPNAHGLLNEFTRRATLRNYLDPTIAEQLQVSADALQDQNDLKNANKAFVDLLDEYFVSEELEEAIQTLKELDNAALHHEFVKVCVLHALDRNRREYELASQLLGAAVGTVVTSVAAENGFEMLLDRVEDMVQDTPDAMRLLATFIARAVVDECIPPAFVQRLRVHHALESHQDRENGDHSNVSTSKKKESGDAGEHVLRSASRLLAMPHAASRLSHCWGPSSLESLKAAVAEIVLEYLIGAGEDPPDDAIHAMEELGTPRYAHEFIKRAFVVALDHKPREIARAQQLIAQFARSNDVLKKQQLRKGLQRIQDDLDDLTKDSPNAKTAYQDLLDFLKKEGIKVE